MVSAAFAREYFKSPAEAIGRRIRNTPSNPWREIVGVIGDERDDGLARPPTPIVYWPLIIDEFWDEPKFVQRNLAFTDHTARWSSVMKGDVPAGASRGASRFGHRVTE